MNHHIKATISGVLIVLLMLGCAGTPKRLKSEDARQTKKLAIVTSMADRHFQVLDESGLAEIQVNGLGFISGSIVGALVVGALSGIASALKKKAMDNLMTEESLGGDPDLLRSTMWDYRMKECFDENFSKVFVPGFEIIGPRTVDSLGIDEFPRTSDSDDAIRDYYELRMKLGADMVVEIDFVYGIAVFGGGVKPSAVVVADVSVISIAENELKMKNTISSHSYHRRAFPINDLAADDGKLFKTEIAEAVQGLAHLIAAEFGAELPLKHKSYWNPNK